MSVIENEKRFTQYKRRGYSVKKQETGFTPIDLIIVITIVAILALAAWSLYGDSNRKAEATKNPTTQTSQILRALDQLPDPKDCFFGVDVYVPPSEIARFLSTHPEFTLDVTPEATRSGPIFKRKHCGENR